MTKYLEIAVVIVVMTIYEHLLVVVFCTNMFIHARYEEFQHRHIGRNGFLASFKIC